MILSDDAKKISTMIKTSRAPSAEHPTHGDEKDAALQESMNAFMDAVHEKDSGNAMRAFKEMVAACSYED